MDRNETRKPLIGLLPAAGVASRLSPSRYPKELLPVVYRSDESAGEVGPVPVIELSLRALKYAGVDRCIVITSDRKPELMRYLGDGTDYGIPIAYVHQAAPSGLAAAVDAAFAWTKGCDCCLMLPDTIVSPAHALRDVFSVLRSERCHLVLGVFPTDVPEQLGPVRFDESGCVLEVLDKPRESPVANTWGMAAWTGEFASLLHNFVAAGVESGGRTLGDAFNLAVKEGLSVRAIPFTEGSFLDIGTGGGLTKMLRAGGWSGASSAPDEPGV